jgi:hypothetical protein
MNLVNVDGGNLSVYLNLCQIYEGEFSDLTGKKPDEAGLFPLDTQIGGNTLGYLLYEENAPIGLAAVTAKAGGENFEICEFYIVPSVRRRMEG